MKRFLFLLSNRIKSLWFSFKLKFFQYLHSKGLITYHNVHIVTRKDREKYPVKDEPITSDRYVFDLSHYSVNIETVRECWYETKSGKRLLTLEDYHHHEGEYEYRIQLESFVAKFSDKETINVIHTPGSYMFRYFRLNPDSTPPLYASPDAPVQEIKAEEHIVDLLHFRYSYKSTHSFDEISSVGLSNLLLTHRAQIAMLIDSKVEEINTEITGTPNDGALTTKSGDTLAENFLCPRCGFPLFNHHYDTIEDKDFLCINCGVIRYPKRAYGLEFKSAVNMYYDELKYYTECS